MGRLFVRIVSAVAAVGLSVTILASGIASADALAGKTYDDAVAAISSWKGKPVIGTVSGGLLETGDCVVTFARVDLPRCQRYEHSVSRSRAQLELQQSPRGAGSVRQLGDDPGRRQGKGGTATSDKHQQESRLVPDERRAPEVVPVDLQEHGSLRNLTNHGTGNKESVSHHTAAIGDAAGVPVTRSASILAVVV